MIQGVLHHCTEMQVEKQFVDSYGQSEVAFGFCHLQQYEQMIKYATALRLGTAETEAILRRFTRTGFQHPTYQAFAELGKVNPYGWFRLNLQERLLIEEPHSA